MDSASRTPPRRRHPLTDASGRANKSYQQASQQGDAADDENSYRTTLGRPKTPTHHLAVPVVSLSPNGAASNSNNNSDRLSTCSQTDTNRNSALSAVSILSGQGKRKTHIGPWQLGRTLGKGATGRVRLAKHAVTGQTAAIKIVSKKSAAMVQSESLAAMDRNACHFAPSPGAKPMPFGIEREVVIMKLIEHPNVISLYDVWENRGEL